MAYQQNTGEKKKPKAPVDFMKIAMSTPCPGNPGQWSSLQWRISGQNIQCVVYTNDPNDKDNDNGRIDVKMPVDQFMVFLANLDNTIRSKVAVKYPMQFLSSFAGQKRLDTPRVTDTLFIGKDAEGLCYITLERRNRPNIVFYFSPKTEQNYRFLNGDGTDMKDSDRSCLYAAGHAKLLNKLVELEMLNRIIKHNEPHEFEAQVKYGSAPAGGGQSGGNQGNSNRGGGGGNGGYNNGGGNQGGNNRPQGGQSQVTQASEEDDDIPY